MNKKIRIGLAIGLALAVAFSTTGCFTTMAIIARTAQAIDEGASTFDIDYGVDFNDLFNDDDNDDDDEGSGETTISFDTDMTTFDMDQFDGDIKDFEDALDQFMKDFEDMGYGEFGSLHDDDDDDDDGKDDDDFGRRDDFER